MPTQAQMATVSAPLRALYVLRTHDEDVVRAQRVFGIEKFTIVSQQLYGPLLPEQQIVLFPLLSALVQQVQVFLLWRPAHRWSVDELVDAILGD